MIWWLMWGAFALAVFIQYYDIYANYTAQGPRGKPVLGLTVTMNGPSDSYPMQALIVFAASKKSCPGQQGLIEVRDRIQALLDEGHRSIPEVNQFADALKQPWQESTRVRLPELIAGQQDLYVGQVELQRDRLHPTWNEHGFVVVAKTGKTKGKLAQLPWQNAHAQNLFSGTAAG